MLRFMGSQGVGHDWVTELNWTEHRIIRPQRWKKLKRSPSPAFTQEKNSCHSSPHTGLSAFQTTVMENSLFHGEEHSIFRKFQSYSETNRPGYIFPLELTQKMLLSYPHDNPSGMWSWLLRSPEPPLGCRVSVLLTYLHVLSSHTILETFSLIVPHMLLWSETGLTASFVLDTPLAPKQLKTTWASLC